MCGIFGYIGDTINKHELDKCAILLSHRGPDHFSTFVDVHQKIYLAHNRLSILDLTENGDQPMSNEDKTIWLTFNGEIYNFENIRKELIKEGHTFRSLTDSEVVVHAYEEWGIECLNRFNGMFAFGLWDSRCRKLFIARDRVGIKPIYYAEISNGFAFASEPKSIISLNFYKREINYNALFDYLQYRYIPGQESIWNGVCKLAPGSYIEFDESSRRTINNKYWRLPLEKQSWNEADALEYFEELLESSVKSQLMSDVPVGVFLSGGYDSTCVTHIAKKELPNLSTFGLGFIGDCRTELKDASSVAKTFKTNHYEYNIGMKDIPKLDYLLEYYDEPLADSSIISTFLLSRESRQHIKVALAGDGGDELFGGYVWYTQIFDIFFKKRNISSIFEQYNNLLYSGGFNINELIKLFPNTSFKTDSEEKELYLKHYREDLEFYKRWQYIDFKTFLVDDILVKVDRASMANSLEVRVPLLDHRMVEFAFSLPDDLCIRDSIKKYLMRKYLEGKVPDQILNKPKKGFGCPILPGGEEVIDSIYNGTMARLGVMDINEFRKLIDGNGYGLGVKLWYLYVLEKWFKKWFLNN